MTKQVPENPVKNRNRHELLMVLSCLLTALYLISNIMAVRIISIGGISIFDAGTITFPLTYMIGDALAEIWGFKTSKKVIFLTFFCNLLLVIFTSIGTLFPYPEHSTDIVQAYNTVFGYVPRIMFASMIAFLCGELINARSLLAIREKTGHKHLWIRTIGSSVLGHSLDTGLFVVLAFAGTCPPSELVSMIVIQCMAKLLVEILCGTPLIYALVHWLKKRV